MTVKAIQLLMVEDNPGDIDLTREALSEGTLFDTENLHVVSDGEQALRFLRQQGDYRNVPRPDLILLDLNLPRVDGREVLAALKEDPNLASIPVVVLSSSSNRDDITRSYDLHANCYVTKPSELDLYIDVVRQIEEFWLNVVRLPGDASAGR